MPQNGMWNIAMTELLLFLLIWLQQTAAKIYIGSCNVTVISVCNLSCAEKKAGVCVCVSSMESLLGWFIFVTKPKRNRMCRMKIEQIQLVLPVLHCSFELITWKLIFINLAIGAQSKIPLILTSFLVSSPATSRTILMEIFLYTTKTSKWERM